MELVRRARRRPVRGTAERAEKAQRTQRLRAGGGFPAKPDRSTAASPHEARTSRRQSCSASSAPSLRSLRLCWRASPSPLGRVDFGRGGGAYRGMAKARKTAAQAPESVDVIIAG